MSTTRYVDVDRALDLLKQDVHPENEAAIRDFIDHQAAEDISELQQHRQVYSLRMLLAKFSPEGFRLREADEDELKKLMANLNRSDYAENTKHKMRCTVKKFYKVQNGGHEHPDKVSFISTKKKEETTVSREDLFTEDERTRLFRSFPSTRDRAFTLTMYESAARPGELLNCTIADFTSNAKGDFIFLQGLKNTPDRTNQLIRSGRPLREWLAQHPLGGELGDVDQPSAPLWVKTEQQSCTRCGEIPQRHDDSCSYDPDYADRMRYHGYLRRFKKACEKADIPENKRRPYNLRHTRLTEVATFMGYEQLNKFAGWVPGSNRAKVYVHLTNDDVNQAIRDEYGLSTSEDEADSVDCPFCSTTNQPGHSECRQCGRPLFLEHEQEQEAQPDMLGQMEALDRHSRLVKFNQL